MPRDDENAFLRGFMGLPTPPSASNALGLGSGPVPGGLANSFAQRPSEALGLGGLFQIGQEAFRRRQNWNDRFDTWMKRESNSETDRIIRAREMVKAVVSSNAWLSAEGVKLVEQGSFTNRTNTRGESDIDLRVVHPLARIEYGYGINQAEAFSAGNYRTVPVTHEAVLAEMRTQLTRDLRLEFGRTNVDDTGSKAITIAENEGTRCEVDVVPSFELHHIVGGHGSSGYRRIVGAGLLSTNRQWTYNYPDQHIAQGRQRHDDTRRRFKKVIRILKRMQADMFDRGVPGERVPSFLIECLVNLVEDAYFLQEEDDWYDRVKRVLHRISDHLWSPNALAVYSYTEINTIKTLFGENQAWTLDSAKAFVARSIAHLGNA